MSRALDRGEELARQIRAELGDLNDPCQPLIWLIRDLVARVRSADCVKCQMQAINDPRCVQMEHTCKTRP